MRDPVGDHRRIEEFRRRLRRCTSQFLAGKVDHARFLSLVRAAATDAGLLTAEPRSRRGRADKVLDALAWGTGSIPPGELPSRLEPAFERFQRGEIDAEQVGAILRDTLVKVVKPPAAGPRK